MFEKILIANRGEIAVRVIKTAARLGVRTVAVYSEADAHAMHVEAADEAVCIGPAAAAQSYLRGDVIIDVAKRSGAQGIHPGYGFLSENAAFARECEKNGIVFIGPPTGAIQAMGSKAESKRLMQSAGVPLVPGYHGQAQDLPTLARAADEIGYPILVKASAGGGGKGMRVVKSSADLPDAIASARRESKAAFGDDSLLLEKYLTRPRHVEIQVFADTKGNCVYLFERDCSLQRRHQKVIEEAPAPGLSADVRTRMGRAAVAAAQAVNYVGAGTVEFLYEDGAFYFIEMNTRLQVEHPVTEMITGFDLVEWQLRVASGEALPVTQEHLQRRGHAFEARVYAEDAEHDFRPAIGKLKHLRPPITTESVRVDTGVRSGDEISIYYDPLIAKLIVWGDDRLTALRRLRRALGEYEVAGVTTNIRFLESIAAHPAFASEEIDTGFIERHRTELAMAPTPASNEVLAFAVLSQLFIHKSLTTNDDATSPWSLVNGWRMNSSLQRSFRFKDGEDWRTATLTFKRGGFEVTVSEGKSVRVQHVTATADTINAEIDGARHKTKVVVDGTRLTLFVGGTTYRLEMDNPLDRDHGEAGAGQLFAPMPGVIISVLVKVGDEVERGQPLIVLEAMKMEHTIKAPTAGRVKELHYAAGQQVVEGADLLDLETADSK